MRLERSFVLEAGRLTQRSSEPPEDAAPFAGELPDLFDRALFDAVIDVKKKRRRISDYFPSAKRGGCTCRRSRCVKGYCDCFADGRACGPECGCTDCLNTEGTQKSLPRPAACRCSQSRCLKQYCPCHRAGRRCGPSCQCTDCCN